jgi:hypothetical protein
MMTFEVPAKIRSKRRASDAGSLINILEIQEEAVEWLDADRSGSDDTRRRAY